MLGHLKQVRIFPDLSSLLEDLIESFGEIWVSIPKCLI